MEKFFKNIFTEVDNKFRSQRCSACGYVNKKNRKSQSEFKCVKCSHTAHADLNAAKNLSFDLKKIPAKVFLQKLNCKGFFWNSDGLKFEAEDNIIPPTK